PPGRSNPCSALSDSDPKVKSRHTVVDGVRCHYLDAGHEPPLVLLHGTAIDSAEHSYGHSLTALARQHRVLALDWPGYGLSERPPSDMSMSELMELLAGFMDQVNAERAHLAGFSMGGAVALGFALRAPQRIESLTLIGSYGLDSR